MSDNYVVLFEYYEYSDSGEFLGLNQDESDVFETQAEAEAYAYDISLKDDVKKAWVSLI